MSLFISKELETLLYFPPDMENWCMVVPEVIPKVILPENSILPFEEILLPSEPEKTRKMHHDLERHNLTLIEPKISEMRENQNAAALVNKLHDIRSFERYDKLNTDLIEKKDSIQKILIDLTKNEDPISLLENIEQPDFKIEVYSALQWHIALYEQSHWYDFIYFSLNRYLSLFNLEFTQENYENYSQQIELGGKLNELIKSHAEIILLLTQEPTSETLNWDDVFAPHSHFCHQEKDPNKKSNENNSQTLEMDIPIMPPDLPFLAVSHTTPEVI